MKNYILCDGCRQGSDYNKSISTSYKGVCMCCGHEADVTECVKEEKKDERK